MKKLLVFTISLVALVTVCTFSVFAADGVARVGDTEYSSLQEAIDAAGTGDTVTLLTDLDIVSDLSNAAYGLFNISQDDKITIDLGTKAINVTDASSGNFIVFYNYGELTIKNGTVNVISTINREWNAQSTVLLNRGGTMVIESGTYAHKGGTAMAFALDNSGNSFGDAYVTINGGTLTSTYTAIRMRLANTKLNGEPGNGLVYLTVNGGTISGANRGVWGHITDAYVGDLGALDVSGGTIHGGNLAINMDSDTYSNVDITISDNAIIDGNINGDTEDYNIIGGTFTTQISVDFLNNGFILVSNSDGTFSISVILESIFTFLGYSVNSDFNSITAGYIVDQELLALYVKQNNLTGFDFGCAFGINAISSSTYTSFAKYTEYQSFNAKIIGIDKTNENHINANLMMALYVDLGNGQGKQFVVGTENGTAIVDAESVPSVTFKSFLPPAA